MRTKCSIKRVNLEMAKQLEMAEQLEIAEQLVMAQQQAVTFALHLIDSDMDL